MNKLVFCSLSILLLLCACSTDDTRPTSEVRLTDHVDPFIGTGGHGHTFPGATLPFGMMQLSPDTRLEGWDGCGGYHYTDSILYGFSHTHLSGTGIPDYCDILFKPCIGEVHLDNGYGTGPEEGYSSYFSKKSEVARPGYYKVLMNEGIQAEVTTGLRAGMHSYRFEDAENAHVVIDLLHRDPTLLADMELVGTNGIRGFRRSSSWAQDQVIYFHAEFSRDFTSTEFQEHIFLGEDNGSIPAQVKAALHFDILDGEGVSVRVGISAVDLKGAEKNLRAELNDFDFDMLFKKADDIWNTALSKIQVQDDGKEEEKTIFYTALYHTMIAPNIYSDADGRYRKVIPKSVEEKTQLETIGHVPQGDRHYTVFSLWDTYRAAHPLYTIIEQDRTQEFIRTFLRQYDDGGRLPVWELASTYTECMIGYHSVSAIADAHQKGLRDYDTDKALEAMRHAADMDIHGLPFYRQKGFISCGDESESVSKTLEYAYDDWCIATMAEALGEQEVANDFYERAQHYKNLYNANDKFLMGRRNGGWYGPFRPEEVNFNYTEANGWQYSLAVPQDVNGLIDLMGSDRSLTEHLDALFEAEMETSGRHQVDITGLIGQYAHGNEPSHHMAYLYNYAGQPWKTQKMVRRIMDEQYWAGPDGLSGNEDCGQMSAWYVLSAMGFYPVCPGDGNYIIGSPLFDGVSIDLENGKRFTIRTEGEGPYISSIELNGEDYRKSYLEHSTLMEGGLMTFSMSSVPNEGFGSSAAHRPVSRIEDGGFVVVPSIESRARTFVDSAVVTLNSPEEAQIYYRLSTEEKEDKAFAPYDPQHPIVLKGSAIVHAYSVKGERRSTGISAEFFKIDGNRSIHLDSEYADQYSAGGDIALIDMIKGGKEYTTGDWQGYREDLDATIDLGRVQEINGLRLGCNQNIKSWIWFPKEVVFELSDSENGPFVEVARIANDFPDDRYGAFIEHFETDWASPRSGRFIRVSASQYGVCPDWHLGAGGKTWIFVDELEVL